jgi:hypothetical protein
MNRLYWIPIIAVLLFVLFIPMQRQPADWSPSWRLDDVRPLGLRVFAEQLAAHRPEKNIKRSTNTLFESIRDSSYSGTLVLVNDALFFDPTDRETLLAFVARGNTALIACFDFDKQLQDSLGIVYTSIFNFPGEEIFASNDSVRVVRYLNRQDTLINFRQLSQWAWLTEGETERFDVLAHQEQADSLINLAMRRKFGAGSFIFSSDPHFFTNVCLLYGGSNAYMDYLIGQLPAGDIWLDDYYKSGRPEQGNKLAFIHNQLPLRSAWFVFLSLLLLTLIFNLKRRQRPIPELPMPRNNSREFVYAVAGIYSERDDHRNLLRLRQRQLERLIRQRYQINEALTDANLAGKLAGASHIDAGLLHELRTDLLHLLSRDGIPAKSYVPLHKKLNTLHILLTDKQRNDNEWKK